MNGVVIAIIVVSVAVLIGFLIKRHLKKQLDDIDGFGGRFTKDQNVESETIIGVYGDNSPREKN